MSEVRAKAEAARKASRKMATLSTEQKNEALNSIADAIWRDRETILKANMRDITAAEALLDEGKLNEAFVSRLKLNEAKLSNVVDMVRSVASLDDPVGKTDYAVELDEGLELYRVSSPIGVIGVIFESRPDALPQIASLCLKSSNTVLLKGGSEARNSNRALYSVIQYSTNNSSIPDGWIQLLEEREEVTQLLELDEYVDLIVPRGSNSFVRYIQDNTRIPVLGHSEGVCHIYIDEKADLEMAAAVSLDAKVQYTSVCNAVDTLLVHSEIADKFLPVMMDRYAKANVEVRGGPETVRILGDRVKEATDRDWGAEYLDYIVSVKVVGDLDEAIDHANRYGSHHTDAIITGDREAALKFMDEVDSACVHWNASTRFSDGYRYGLGAEVGISTGKIHARGPTGLEGLTIYKYRLVGSGETVETYTGGEAKRYTHRRLPDGWADFKKM